MTPDEITALSDQELADRHQNAMAQRLYYECDDAAHPTNDPYWVTMREARDLENAIAAEIHRRTDQ